MIEIVLICTTTNIPKMHFKTKIKNIKGLIQFISGELTRAG